MSCSVLLVFPPGWVRISPMPPLGLAEISAAMRDNNIECRTVDLEIECYLRNMSQGENCDNLVQRLTEPFIQMDSQGMEVNMENPMISEIMDMLPIDGVSLVAFSVMGQRQWAASVRIAARLRREGYLTAVGGCYVTLHIDEVSAAGVFHYAFPSLTVKPFLELCRMLGMDVPVNGVTEVRSCNEPTPTIHPTPCYPEETWKYSKALADMYGMSQQHLVLQYRLDHGCIWNCSFCVRQRLGKYTQVSVDDVIESISELVEKHETRTLSLVTNAININTRYARRLFCALVNANLGLHWYTYATPCGLDDDLIKDMARTGCQFIRLGIESGSDRMLKLMGKGFRIAEAEDCLRRLHAAGIWTQVNFIFGFPQETEQDAILSLAFVEKNHEYIDSIRINPFYLQEGSDLFNRPDYYGIRIVGQEGRRIAFDELNGQTDKEKCSATIGFINQMYRIMNAHDIGYTGIAANLLLCALVVNSTRHEAKAWFREKYPYLFKNLSYEAIRWRIYHRRELSRNPFGDSWRTLCGATFEDRRRIRRKE